MNDRAIERIRLVSGHVASRGASASEDDGCGPLAAAPASSLMASALGASNFPQCSTAAAFPEAKHDTLFFDDFLQPEEKAVRHRVRAVMEREVAPVIAGYWERAEFPFQLVPKLREMNVGGLFFKDHCSTGVSLMSGFMAVVEMARVDTSISTFLMVHGMLAGITIALFGSEEQKRELVPKMSNLDLIGCWALTEPDQGSDASALTTMATRVPGGWQLNGRKRWIGNATFADVAVIWARNAESGQVNAFLVRKGTPGYHTKKIENKIALRCVQNADIHLDNVFVPDSARLPGVHSFRETGKILAISRIAVGWQPVGIAAGVYDMCLRYLKQRRQFGTQLASFQLAQEKLSRMLGNIQAMWLMSWRLTKLQEEGRMTHGTASMVKAWNTLRCRETVALGRELLGGNGIVTDFHVAKAFCDLEAIYTYEGTYDINALVAAREATGISAVKAAAR
ncbi:unnamed protein product [Ostreobium quekettii]|uniref:Acyl-coenzyme A oxidase 4, peroxisomal n=1 Tax=Ostreobium quekettii TaxID=121088 RepID=A0A8S1IX44_9CHLO|nr:unnamed protein product [Ostreobium quekettii]|eukprot:evm.model.scf_424.3 EVM.evm.TU.scf_424.3   scf_424:7916-13668(-)